MPFNIKDMAISLDAFGSAPIKAEGQAVKYDADYERGAFIPVHSHEVDVSFDPRDGEFQNANEEWQE